ncbi:hypothetical protein JCM16303_002524 [Sporobolomyces ruberrimus]
MEDDELDPAFAEYDFPAAPLSSAFQDFESHPASRGGGDFDEDSFGMNEYGNGLGDELAELGGMGEENGFEAEDRESRKRHAPSRDTMGHSEAASNRMSLAFELASASDSNGRGSSLLRELGLEEEEEGEDGAESKVSHGRDEEFETQGSPDGQEEGAGNGSKETVSQLDSFPRNNLARSPHLRTTSPVSTLVEDPIDEDALARAFEEIITSLEDSIASVKTSLSHLHDNLQAALPPVQQPTAYHVADTSPRAPSAAPGTPPTSFADRQPFVETLASSLIKLQYAASKTRETQVRTVTECERVFSRNEAGWDSILSELEPLPEDFGSDHPSSSSGSSTPTSTGPSSESSTPVKSFPATIPQPSSQPRNPAVSPSSLDSTNSLDIVVDFRELRTVTTTILAALASVSDIVQVQSALASDAGRKLRALRAQVAGVKDELVQLDQSEAFVAEYEERARRRGKREYAKEAREVMRGMEAELELATVQAHAILEVR